MSESCDAVQVVSVDDEGRYVLAAESLCGVTLRAELRGLPVAVVSVAGATRGGKSFLLNFMLRYLRATPSARSDGSWLGALDEPLIGFNWRGGCERVTTGIMLCSEPFVLTRDNGQKVVVLLMDTQGTFDISSTIRDSTTLFALSTLLSSVQIYNLSSNIQEDNLQHLQLFTHYRKLARYDKNFGKPLQVLQFLVRDWSNPYQYPFGKSGGHQLLEETLKINDGQAEELKEIREHIKSCFESVQCFLMPHPGLTVATSPIFTGSLADVSTEFKNALLELIPQMFSSNLALKEVNSEEIQVQDLINYFESYMEIFNSDELPTPVTILKATSSACLKAAMSRDRDRSGMEPTSGERSVPHDALLSLHEAARAAARNTLKEYYEKLNMQLIDLYKTLNEVKEERTMCTSKPLYCDQVESRFSELDSDIKYLRNKDLPIYVFFREFRGLLFDLRKDLFILNEDAVNLAMRKFDDSRLKQISRYFEDKKGKELQQELEDSKHFLAAIVAAIEKYEEEITQAHAVSILCVHPRHLMVLNENAKRIAISLFESTCGSRDSAQNEHRTGMLTKLHERFLEIQSINVTNNEKAVDKALKFYEDTMTGILETASCLHPQDLTKEHEDVYNNAIADFYSSRTYGNEEYGRDNFMLKLRQEITSRQKIIININEAKNKAAVKTAYELYDENMRIVIHDLDAVNRHDNYKSLAVNKFKNELRRAGPQYDTDEHLDELNKLLTSQLSRLLFKLCGNLTKNALSVASLASVFYRR